MEPKYWSFSFSSSPSNEYSGLVASRIDHPPHENSAVPIFFVFANLIVGKKVFYCSFIIVNFGKIYIT